MFWNVGELPIKSEGLYGKTAVLKNVAGLWSVYCYNYC